LKNYIVKNKETLLFLFWGILAIFFSNNHVVWRDEMRALSIVKDSSSIVDLIFNNLKNEGHPGLWYVALYIAYSVFKANWVLKLCSLIFGFINTYLILYKIRLPFIVKILLLFSYLFFFEYTIISRNYGIALTFILILFLLYEKSLKPLNCFLFFVSAFLLSQTNLIGLLISFFFVSLYLLEQKDNIYVKTILALSTMLLSVFLFYYSTKIDINSVFYLDKTILFNKLLNSNLFQLLIPYYFFCPILGGTSNLSIIISIVIILLMLWNIRTSVKLTLFFYITMVIIQLINLFIYNLCSRHLGLVLIIYLLFSNKILENKKGINISNYMFIFFLIAGILQMAKEIQKPLSSAKEVGKYISKISKNNTILGEKDFFLESIAYYSENPIYIAREGKFKKYSSFTKQNKDTLRMSEIFLFSDSIKQDVFFIFDSFSIYKEKKVRPFFNYKNKIFIFDTIIPNRIKFLNEFKNASSEENYDLLLITKP
jgi:hypothetical protein